MIFIPAFIASLLIPCVSAEGSQASPNVPDHGSEKPSRMSAPVVVKRWPSVSAFEAETGRLVESLPVRRDLKPAIALSMTHLVSLFDQDRDFEPFFYANCRVEGTGEMHHSVNIGIPHVVGRCLLGLAMGESVSGVAASEDGVSILERYCRISFEDPGHLNSYVDPARGNVRFVEFHNMREGLYSLWALMVLKQSSWAHDTAQGMLSTLDGLTDENGFWVPDRAKDVGLEGRCEGMGPHNATRLVDPLVAYYVLTSEPLALDLARRYARAGDKVLFESDGRFAPMDRSSGHVHSITSSLSGIASLASLTQDRSLLLRCQEIVDHGVPEYFSSWGWGDEVFPEHPADVISRGEINQTGDVIRTALILGASLDPAYYDLADRFVRSMLLPTQHTQADLQRFMKDNPGAQRDAERDVIHRSNGGFSMQLPNDRMREGDWPISTLDITSGAVHALSEVWRHRCAREGKDVRINLLFDVDEPDLSIRSALPLEGRVDLTVKARLNLLVRVPGWVDPSTIRASVDGKPRSIEVRDGHVRFKSLKPGQTAVLSFDVPVKTEEEIVDGIHYTTTWVGDQIIEILPRGKVSPLPF